VNLAADTCDFRSEDTYCVGSCVTWTFPLAAGCRPTNSVSMDHKITEIFTGHFYLNAGGKSDRGSVLNF